MCIRDRLWTPEPHGLDANFYNRVCVPLGMLVMLLLMVCPWLRWDGGLRDAPRFWLALGAFVASGAAFFFLGYRQPVALLAAAGSVACLAGLLASLPSLPGKGGWRAVGAVGPVSYTHLDVYKRQLQGHAGRQGHRPGAGPQRLSLIHI